MCGRYIILNGRKIFATTEFLAELERKRIQYVDVPRYNAAPMQRLPIVIHRNGELQAVEATWWLIPRWSKTGKPDTTFSAFNARAEQIAQSKLYGSSFKTQRCLVPADGFYEWRRVSAKEKHPMCIRLKGGKPMFFGGVYSVWKDEKENEIVSFSIVTTEPNELMSTIHTRMPVILPENQLSLWLDPEETDAEKLKKLLVPYPADEMIAYRVSPHVNNARNDDPECMKPADS